jgi:hypothetical protein
MFGTGKRSGQEQILTIRKQAAASRKAIQYVC